MTTKKPKKHICILLAAILLAALIPACSPAEKRSASYFDLFDTVITLTAYADDRTFARMNEEAEASFRHYNELFDVYNEYEGVNNLAVVNRRAGEATAVEPDVIGLIEKGVELEKLTDGRVNIAMGAVLRLWHDCRINAEKDPYNAVIPTAEALDEAALHCWIDDVVVDREGGTVLLRDPLMSLDVGAIAKGYAADKISEELKGYGVPFLLNCGGAILTYGEKPGFKPWAAGIDDPFGDGFSATVKLVNSALSTSGSYLRSFTAEGKEYGHIIDPDTLMPADVLESVSVIMTGEWMACSADALSTACFILGAEEGMRLIDGIEGAEAMFVMKDGSLLFSEGFPHE